jgi:trans-aconitate methyltransferase
MGNTEIKWNSQLYEKKHAFVYKYGEELVGILNPVSGETILDLGCGTGNLTSLIKETGAEVLGIDLSPDMIASAKKNFPKIDFQVKDASTFSFPLKFDAVFSNAVLHWINEKEKAIDCIFNCLKPGGRMVVEFGGKGNNNNMLRTLKEAFIKKGHLSHAQISFWYFPSIADYSGLLEQRGFNVVNASLFDRPTELDDPENGMKNWFKMFGEKFFKGLPEEEQEDILNLTQDMLRKTNFKNGKWYADYKRIRIVAEKD